MFSFNKLYSKINDEIVIKENEMIIAKNCLSRARLFLQVGLYINIYICKVYLQKQIMHFLLCYHAFIVFYFFS